MHFIKPADRQQFTFMQSLDDLVGSDNPVRVIDAIVDAIIEKNPGDFSDKGQSHLGRKAYNPGTFLKLYIYGYLNGISSSRKLEIETHRNIELIWLLGNLRPDFKTIADYRKDNGEDIRLLTRRFREFLCDQGFIQGKTIGIDGTRVKANANRSMLSAKKIERRISSMNEKIEDYLGRLMENDKRDDILEELEAEDGSEINQELIDKIAELEERLRSLGEQKETLNKESRGEVSESDPDARLMRSRDGMIPAYNVQLAVDEKNNLITGSMVGTEPNDQELLEPVLEHIKEELGIEPEEVLGDRGYASFTAIQKVESNGKTTCFIPLSKHKNDANPIRFTYNEEKDEYVCERGKSLPLKAKNKYHHGQYMDVYQGIECEGCPVRSQCTRSKYGRIIQRPHNRSWREAYRRRLETVLGKSKVKLRKSLVEHPFGTIRYWMGKIPLLLRGKDKVATEINIYTTAYNVKRLISLKGSAELIEMINRYDWARA
jgi:transposase